MLRQVLIENLGRGRHKKYYQRHPDSELADYVRHVAHIYLRDHVFFDALLIEQNNEAWKALHQDLYNWFRRRLSKYKHGQNLEDAASALTQEMCIKLLDGRAKYTYDAHNHKA